MSSDDNNCDNEEGEDCNELSMTGLVILIWMFVGFGVNWFLRVVYVPYSHVFVEVF
ncbi:unnamed protein product, partial [Ectocarpus fasciculatus]